MTNYIKIPLVERLTGLPDAENPVYRVVSERSKGRGLGPRFRKFESYLLDWQLGSLAELVYCIGLENRRSSKGGPLVRIQ